MLRAHRRICRTVWTHDKFNQVTTIPAIRYADADKAIEWLKNDLGFTAKAVYRNKDGAVEHAELLLGTVWS
jgi:hypothetical protein